MPEPLSCYICPLCASPLQQQQKSYLCANKHCFDLAKEGYLNLLPVQFKHSMQPGDNKAMLQARREFLEAGYYQPLADAISAIVDTRKPRRSLDLGCGEGYYSRSIETLCGELHGVDIAKFAVAAASKKQPNARFIVASANRLPYVDCYFDFVLRVFAPSNGDELNRILKPSGLLLTVTPGPKHLPQLKAFIYDEVKDHALENELPPGFERIDTQRLSYKISPAPQHRMALLQMTPFAWRANENAQQALKDAAELEIDADFMLTLAVKAAS